jgi:hypothetical protein
LILYELYKSKKKLNIIQFLFENHKFLIIKCTISTFLERGRTVFYTLNKIRFKLILNSKKFIILKFKYFNRIILNIIFNL